MRVWDYSGPHEPRVKQDLTQVQRERATRTESSYTTGRVGARGRVARGVTTLPRERTLRGGPIAPRRRKKLGRAGIGAGSIPEGSRGRVKYISWYKTI
jgi:hypothetical protein